MLMYGKRILIVEDDVGLTQMLCCILEHRLDGRCQVATSLRGDDALIMLKREHFDLVVTDLNMPGMNGLELIRYARHISPQTRAILITGCGSLAVEEQARQLTATYLPKPFHIQEFLTTVQGALS